MPPGDGGGSSGPHEPRRRALAFGVDAERYDRARPSYPAALIDDLVRDGPRRVLDVGTGTGKLGRLLAARGCEVLGVDPDERMAEVARRRGLAVQVARFEDWNPAAGARFDLVVCGQAWHWIDPRLGPAKAADLLHPGGALALCWNRPRYQPAIRAGLDAVYDGLGLDLASGSAALGNIGADKTEADAQLLTDSGHFESVEVRSYRWEHAYSAEAYLDQLQTHSDHLLLDRPLLQRLLAGVGEFIETRGGRLIVDYTTILIRAATRSP